MGRSIMTGNTNLKTYLITIVGCLLFFSETCLSQMFAPTGSTGSMVSSSAVKQKADSQAAAINQIRQEDNSKVSGQAQRVNARLTQTGDSQNQGNAIWGNNNTVGNTAGYRYQTQTYNIGNVNQQKPKPQIFIYMRDFKVSRTLNGSINCSMRFYVYTTLKEKLTNLSCRLKWPDMETVLVFDDVEPDTRTYFDYSLLGEGCYGMDKAPNIIVNRCRVKGMTQQQCAQNIRWAN